MKVLRRKILLDDLKRFDDGVAYDTITATSIYMKVEMTQTIDDLGMVTNLPFEAHGDACAGFNAFLVVNNVNCYDPNEIPAPTGSIEVHVIGGEAPYTYNWDDGTLTSTIYGVTVGSTKSVNVTDANGCFVTLIGEVQGTEVATPTILISLDYDWFHPFLGVVIPANEQFAIDTLEGHLTICPGGVATLDGGAGYSSYVWSTNATTQTIAVDVDGVYDVSVQDENGCVGASESIMVHVSQATIPVIQPVEIPPHPDGVTPQGDGTESNPIVMCAPFITDEWLVLELLDGELYDFIKWSNEGSGITSDIIGSGLMCIFVETSDACSPELYPLYASNTICVQYITDPAFCN